ncbi:MAG: GNAT family N-acetyltransferase [Minwuia sp.]|nr:GNAT family N-acetyltransferase [Minwuia sp.]
MLDVRPARSDAEVAAARRLFLAYAASLDFDLGFQGFDAEMARFPGEYVPPDGDILLACHDDATVGVVALRRFDGNSVEMKRLYLDPAARGLGAGRRLTVEAITLARNMSYAHLRLDTASSMTAAIQLYRDLGFRQLDPPSTMAGNVGAPDLLYFVLDL